MLKVKVMKPIFRPEVPAKFVLYPYSIFHIKLFYKRLGRKDRELDYFAYVDLYRFGVERGDDFIELKEWAVKDNVIMEENCQYEEAKEKAIESAFMWGNMMVISWWTPRIEVVKEAKAYKVFWIFEENGEEYVMDSLTGEKFKLKDIT